MSMFDNKTILITGATGLLGTHLVKKLLEYKDCRVIALGRSLQKLKEVFDGYEGNLQALLLVILSEIILSAF